MTHRRTTLPTEEENTLDYTTHHPIESNEGSFEIPLNKITEAKPDRVWGTPYFRLRYQTPSGDEKACALVFVSAMNAIAAGGMLGLAFAKSPYDQLDKAIEKLKATLATDNPPKYCPHCGHQLAVEGAFCPNCGTRT